MPTLLHIDSSPLATSVSRELTREFAQTWQNAHPGGEVLYRDLAQTAIAPIDAEWIGAAYTPAEALTDGQREKLSLSDALIGELEQAQHIVIGVAMHNYSIPAVLRLWVDQVVRRGKTFSYTSGGPVGLLKGKKATVILASGGLYDAGSPAAAMNHAEPYLRTILSAIGIADVTFLTVGGTAKLMSGAVSRPAFLQPALEQVRASAA